MGYFYGKTAAALFMGDNSRNNKCLTESYINKSNGSIVEKNDGTVSVYMPNGPVVLSKVCCEALKTGYYFDIDTQKCKWGNSNYNACAIENPFKITLNPEGNDGTLFSIEKNENCTLEINFDYLFKFKCEKLSSSLLQQNAVNTEISDVTNQINQQKAICNSLSNKILLLEKQINATSYSITCETTLSNYETWDYFPIGGYEGNFTNFNNTGFVPFGWNWYREYPIGDINPKYPPRVFYDNNFNNNIITTVTYCLTEPKGLIAWSQLLGNRYQSFLDGDATSYSCADVNAMVAANTAQIAPYGWELLREGLHDATPVIDNGYIVLCSTPFGTKTNLIKELNVLKGQQSECETQLSILNANLTSLNTTSLTSTPCSNPIEAFENLDVSMLIEVVNGSGLITVSETPLFTPIGSGMLYDYLKTKANSGFYVCGTPPDGNTSITACTPLIMSSFLAPYSFDLEDYGSTYKCSILGDNLYETLFTESKLTDTSLNRIVFNNSLSPKVFASKWLSFSTEITDTTILKQIENQNIKISFKVNSHCGDFCLLLDDIQINKKCTIINEKNVLINKSPGFELERIRDNKKSWVKNTTLENRPFSISTYNDTNNIRQTNYDVSDERLVINTKEIDLDISLASAIESDVWCYIMDNPCLLTGYTSGQTICQSGNTCGDNNIDFNILMTQPLSSVTTIEEFEYFLTSELIDAKSRKTLSSYPTLRALYDRYMNSFDYCGTESSKFDYLTMDKFANLIGDYWIDLVEQVVPATTIWGSAKIYSNNIFDQQKFQYKKGSLFTCIERSSCLGLDNFDYVHNNIECLLKKFYQSGCTI